MHLALLLALDLFFLRWVGIHFGNWGFWDWDFQQTLLEVSRQAVLTHQQIPLWNPYIGGGSSLAGNTLNHVFGPCFAIILMFGTVTGVKLCIFLYLALAQLGMYKLARERGLQPESAIFSAALFTMGGFYAQRMTHGHFEWIAVAWMPFILLYLHRAVERPTGRLVALAATFFSFLFLDGGPYQFAFFSVFAGAYASVLALERRRVSPLFLLAGIISLGAGLAAIKLLPVFSIVSAHPRPTVFTNFYGAPFTPTASELLYQMFVSRQQHHQAGEWMPYILNIGCYVGWIPLLLAGLTACTRMRRNALWLALLGLFLWIAIGAAAPIDLWALLHRVPGLSALRVPSRFNVFALLLLALFAGEGLQILRERLAGRGVLRFAPAAILAFVALDVSMINGGIFKVAFSIPPTVVAPPEPFVQHLESPYLESTRASALYPTFDNWPCCTYATLLENAGVIHGFRTITFSSNTIAFDNPLYRGEAWFASGPGSVGTVSVTPNSTSVETNGLGGILAFNINYDPGWTVANRPDLVPFARAGRVAVEVPEGTRDVEIAYRPASFFAGAAISGATALILLSLLLHDGRGRPSRVPLSLLYSMG